MEIQITADSTCDLTPELIKRFNIKVLPLVVTLGEETFFDGVDIKPDDIYAYFKKTGELPKTGARSIEDYKDFFKSFTDKGKAVVHVSIGSDLSSGYSNSVVAAKELKNVYVVDSKTLSSAVGLHAMYAAELAKAGKLTAKEIAEKTENRANSCQASFIIEKLKFLAKGGRCSRLAAFGANILGIKPSIQVVNGKNEVGKKYMGKYLNCISKYIDDTLAKYNTPDTTRVMITYSTATQDMIDLAKSKLSEYGKFKEIMVTQAGSVINCHCGENTIGILYFNDGDKNHYNEKNGLEVEEKTTITITKTKTLKSL